MRVKDDFTVYPRKLGSGKVVFYYQCYDAAGRRTHGRSTGESRRTMAVKVCNALMRAGKLLPDTRKRIPAFEEFAGGFWDWETSRYIKKQNGRRDITKSYTDTCKRAVKNQITPYFGKVPLDQITENAIEEWLLGFVDRGYKNTYGNSVLGVFNVMLGEAVKAGIIKTNPAADIRKLKDNRKGKKLLTPEEVRKLFPADWSGVWSDEISYMANKLAACTGMRIGEILGLKGCYVYRDYLEVCGQHGAYGYRPTKTKTNRNIPIAPVIYGGLVGLAERNGEGYLFSHDGGKKPVLRWVVYEELFRALKKIGIDGDTARERGINLHSWRHFFNTTLRMANVADCKVQSVTGHASIKSTDRYTHFDSREFAEVRKVQETVLLAAPVEEQTGAANTGQASGTAKPGTWVGEQASEKSGAPAGT
jgi:integrase